MNPEKFFDRISTIQGQWMRLVVEILAYQVTRGGSLLCDIAKIGKASL